MQEGTVFERQSITGKFRRIIIPVIIFLVIMGIFFVWARISTGSHTVLQEARDVRVAMKLIGVEYSGDSSRIYDPSSSDGMVSGIADKIEKLSYADGEVRLISWDVENSLPLAFTYSKGMYLVEYRAVDPDDPNSGEWNVYYAIHVTSYSTEK